MADAKISALAAVTSLGDTDEAVLAVSGASKKITGANIKASVLTAATITALSGFSTTWTLVIKAIDESVSSSTASQDDDELFFTAANGGMYEVEIVLIYASPLSAGTPDLKVLLGEDTTVRGSFTVAGLSTSDSTPNTIVLSQSNASTSFGTAAANRILVLRGSHAGAGGTFKVRWTQNTSDGNPTTVRAGSLIRYRRIV